MPTAAPIVALVSGANQGVGRAVAISLAQNHGYHVLVGSRKLEAGQSVATELTTAGYKASAVQLDLESDESIAAVVDTISSKFGRLDVLVNNAGILLETGGPFAADRPALPTRELFNRTFSTNVTGTACLTDALLPLLRKAVTPPGPRLVFVSSVMGSLTMATNKETSFYPIDYYAYDSSKAAFNMLMLNYARKLDDVGGKVNAACPGLVRTGLTNFSTYGVPPEEAAKRVVELATLGSDGPSATFSNSSGPLPW